MPKIRNLQKIFLAYLLSSFSLVNVCLALPTEEKVKLLFTGDIFLDRTIDKLTQEDNKKNKNNFTYPFSGLSTLSRGNYDAWIGNLECPVTKEQSTQKEKNVHLKFSCKSDYLPGLAKYFDIVSLANNHTDNMKGEAGQSETRENLEKNKIKYFGDFDSSKTLEICKVFFVENKMQTKIPIAFCGFNGVFKLPTENELKVIKDYSKYFITVVYPHQGEEYKFTNNSYQKKVYRQMIDTGADIIIGSHPHVIQNVEKYKGKFIFYSLGNFIFDQLWIKTRKHMTLDTEIVFANYNQEYTDLAKKCLTLSNQDCLDFAGKLKIVKPAFALKFTPIFTYSNLDFITKKEALSEKEYNKRLAEIGFTKASKTQ